MSLSHEIDHINNASNGFTFQPVPYSDRLSHFMSFNQAATHDGQQQLSTMQAQLGWCPENEQIHWVVNPFGTFSKCLFQCSYTAAAAATIIIIIVVLHLVLILASISSSSQTIANIQSAILLAILFSSFIETNTKHLLLYNPDSETDIKYWMETFLKWKFYLLFSYFVCPQSRLPQSLISLLLLCRVHTFSMYCYRYDYCYFSECKPTFDKVQSRHNNSSKSPPPLQSPSVRPTRPAKWIFVFVCVCVCLCVFVYM